MTALLGLSVTGLQRPAILAGGGHAEAAPTNG